MRPQAVARILDANLDRAREGLRVLEEWFRFGLEEADWASECKGMRQALAQWHADPLRLARDTAHDLGGEDSYPDTTHRRDLKEVLQANCGRVQEALRVLEEYSKLGAEHLLVHAEMAVICKKMRYRLYEIETHLLGGSRQHTLHHSRLYLVTQPVAGWLTVVEQALQGGVSIVQYRHKQAESREIISDLQQLQPLCHRYRALMLVNDRVDLALAVNADGVHLGQTDLPIEAARHLLGPHKLIGMSTTNPEEVALALSTPVDYLGIGPVYATPTKADKPAVGLDFVRYARDHVSLPWFAIGGIDLTNVAEVQAAGAERVAVVRALMQSSDPYVTARQFLTQLSSRQPFHNPMLLR
ncbi:MAG: thiamine phosphate synthase [Synechococcaceae cyanobacterium SM2_3_1]|nr:thiamine phosphate synthase [Synechococcaceae cyanobacterium SM2_3_1]